MKVEIVDPPKVVTITLTGSSDIASMKYLLELAGTQPDVETSTMWYVAKEILEKLR